MNSQPWIARLGAVVAAALLSLATQRPALASDSPSNEDLSIEAAAGVDAAAPEAETAPPKAHLDIYGFAMLDTGYDFKQVDPNWFDVVRPTKLPSLPNEFGDNGNWYAGVRQSRLGFKGYMPTSLGEVKTIFEFELFGTGVDAGQTTFRLRHAWGELGQFGAGQTWSPFMDPDVFPNSLEYWGPSGMVFFRNVQVKWMPMRGENELFFALERPGASADQGNYADRIQEQGVKPHFPAPDFSLHYKRSGDWGHVQLAGIVRYISWTDAVPDQVDLSGHATGWGINASTNIKTPMNGTIRASVVYGEGVENYMNDAPADIGVETNPTNPNRPFLGKPLPVLGIVGFYDFNWNERFSSCIGYSYIDIKNKDGAAGSAFKTGQYALANLLYYPIKNVMAGLEFQWGRRENFSDGFKVDDYRIQFSARYNFSFSVGGAK
ncbi:MAG TPA: DcaP family trimeric outer membrane transporter [Thermoanaerobaculia bacterium]